MLKRLRSYFQPVEVRQLPLNFEMDQGEGDQHIVRVYVGRGNARQQVRNVSRLWVYGFKHEARAGTKQVTYILSDADRQTLLALKSLNPQVMEDGSLVFEVEPLVLKYIRSKKNLEENPASRRVQISDQPLQPTAQISFDPESGLKIRTGYEGGEQGSLVSAKELRTSRDKRYARFGNNFKLLAEVSDSGRELLEQGEKLVPVAEAASFLEKDLPVIGKEFNVLHDPTQPVQISDQLLKPAARINHRPGTDLQVETGFDLGRRGHLTPLSDLQTSRDGKYVLVDRTFYPLPGLSQKARNLLEHHIQVFKSGEIPEFFQRDLVLIRKEFNAVLTDLAQQIRVVTDSLTPMVKVNVDGRGWLDFQVEYQAAGFVLPQGLLAKRKGEDYIQLDNHTWVKVDRSLVEKTGQQLEALGAVEENEGFRLPVSEFVSLEEFIEHIGGQAELSKAYQDFIAQLTGFTASDQFALSPNLEEQLIKHDREPRSYQRAGIHWLNWLRSNYLHGILADDMGLGKTLQSLCALRLAYEETKSQQHSLIVAPKSVLPHWEREVHRCYPQMRVYVYHGTGRDSRAFRASQPRVFITTYDTVNRDISELSKTPFFYLILDEATRIKNPDAQRTQAIKALNAAHRLALSGTPIENRPAELWSVFDFLMRGHLGHFGTFVRIYENQIMSGDGHTAKQLGRRISPFVLRRKKEEVAKDLPEKITLQEWCDLTEEQRQLYGGLQDAVESIREALRVGEKVSYTGSILPVLTKLKQICDHPALVTGETKPLYGRSEKFDWIIARIDEIIQSNEQVVVFSHFLNMLSLFETAIRERNYTYIRVDGSTDNRQALIDHFNEGKARIALLSILAAGHGINLTAANHVIHADRWWNPAVEDQATDRVHRIGQNRTVYVYHILVQGTLEERIDSLLERKRGMADQIVGAAVEGPRQWTREELIELLKPLD